MGSEGDKGAGRGAQELLGCRGRIEEGEPPPRALHPSIMPTGYPSFEPGPLQECAPTTSRRLGTGVVELEWGCPRGGISQALGAEAGVLAWEGLAVRPTLLASVTLSSSTQSPLVTQGSEHSTPPSHPGHWHHGGAVPENLHLLHEAANPARPLLHGCLGLRRKAENRDSCPR